MWMDVPFDRYRIREDGRTAWLTLHRTFVPRLEPWHRITQFPR